MIKAITAAVLFGLVAHGCQPAQAASVGARDGRDGKPTEQIKPSDLSGGPVKAERPLTPTEKANPGLKPYPHDPINRSGHSEPRWFLTQTKPTGDASITRFITHFATLDECKKALKDYDNQSGFPLDCREVATWVADD